MKYLKAAGIGLLTMIVTGFVRLGMVMLPNYVYLASEIIVDVFLFTLVGLGVMEVYNALRKKERN